MPRKGREIDVLLQKGIESLLAAIHEQTVSQVTDPLSAVYQNSGDFHLFSASLAGWLRRLSRIRPESMRRRKYYHLRQIKYFFQKVYFQESLG